MREWSWWFIRTCVVWTSWILSLMGKRWKPGFPVISKWSSDRRRESSPRRPRKKLAKRPDCPNAFEFPSSYRAGANKKCLCRKDRMSFTHSIYFRSTLLTYVYFCREQKNSGRSRNRPVKDTKSLPNDFVIQMNRRVTSVVRDFPLGLAGIYRYMMPMPANTWYTCQNGGYDSASYLSWSKDAVTANDLHISCAYESASANNAVELQF